MQKTEHKTEAINRIYIKDIKICYFCPIINIHQKLIKISLSWFEMF